MIVRTVVRAGRKWRNKPWRSVVVTLALLFMGLKIADWQYPLALPEPSAVYSTLVVDRHGQPLRAFADHQAPQLYTCARLAENNVVVHLMFVAEPENWHNAMFISFDDNFH